MLIPGFGFLGGGVSEYMRAKRRETGLPSASSAAGISAGTTGPAGAMPTTALPNNANTAARRFKHSTAEMTPPESVTEGTTRHLDADASKFDPRA